MCARTGILRGVFTCRYGKVQEDVHGSIGDWAALPGALLGKKELKVSIGWHNANYSQSIGALFALGDIST